MSVMSLPVIVTRAEPGASKTATWLEAEGHRPILSPAIVLHSIDPEPSLVLDGLQGLIFTSANGVRFFCKLEERRDLTVWCVGSNTSDAARAGGFSDLHTGAGDSGQLVEHIIESAALDAGGFLHVGNSAAGEVLAQRLQVAGFEAQFTAIYESLPATELSAEALSLIGGPDKYVVLIHSAKGAEAFAELAAGYDFINAILVAISDQAAAPLKNAGFGRTIFADDSSRDAMSQALKRVRAAL